MVPKGIRGRLIIRLSAPNTYHPQTSRHLQAYHTWPLGSKVRLALTIFVPGGVPWDMLTHKKDSPSSDLFRVKVYNEHGMAQRNGTGMFPREVMNRFPLLPLEEEGRLNDMLLRENFIERVFGLRRKAWLSAWQFACGKLPSGKPCFPR